MAVFRYDATSELRENSPESGIVVAKDTDEAKIKVEQDGFDKVSIKQIRGVAALWKGFTADIK